MPRVLFIGNFLSGSGTHRSYCEDLCDRLEASGWEITRSSSRKARLSRAADMIGTTLLSRNHYEAAHIDLYSGAAFLWAEAVAAILSRFQKPFVVTLHGGSLPTFAARWPRRVRRLLSSAAAVTAPSSYLAVGMANFADDITVLPNALDMASLPFSARTRPRLRLLWLRAFHEVYNPSMAIDVLARLRARHGSVHLTMVGADKGDGSLEATKARAAALDVQANVNIVPGVPRTEVAALMRDSDVFINTTNADNAPVSVLEAMASGLCVVSTDVGGIPHLLTHGRDALLVPASAAADMAAAIERLVDEPDLAASLSQRAHERAFEHDWSPILERWTQLLGQVARRA